MDEAETEMNRLLRQRRRIAEGMKSDFTIRNLATFASVEGDIFRVLSDQEAVVLKPVKR